VDRRIGVVASAAPQELRHARDRRGAAASVLIAIDRAPSRAGTADRQDETKNLTAHARSGYINK
jgi:hypothetical protein